MKLDFIYRPAVVASVAEGKQRLQILNLALTRGGDDEFGSDSTYQLPRFYLTGVTKRDSKNSPSTIDPKAFELVPKTVAFSRKKA